MKTEDLIINLLVVEKCDELCETTVLFIFYVRLSRVPMLLTSAPKK
jgi:hypothetical protein